MLYSEALQQYGLHWNVSAQPCYTRRSDGSYQEIDGHQAIVRSDDGHALSVTGSRYVPIQNDALAPLFDAIVERTGANYVNGGVLARGARTFVQAELPEPMLVKGVDEIRSLLSFLNSHDGSTKAGVGFTNTRVVCKNTFAIVMRDVARDVTVRHTRSAEMLLAQADQVINAHIAYAKQIELKCNWLADQRFNDLQMERALEDMFDVVGVSQSEISTRTRNNMDAVRSLFVSGTGINASNRGTAWAAYNAVTEYVDHKRSVKGLDENPNARVESSLFGSGLLFKDHALQAIDSVLAS